jgi:hypothetical protein
MQRFGEQEIIRDDLQAVELARPPSGFIELRTRVPDLEDKFMPSAAQLSLAA